jgi:plasmid stabilization system protein ParE
LKPYQILEAAEDDLFAIWAFIAADNPDAADRIEKEIRDAFARIAQNPASATLGAISSPTNRYSSRFVPFTKSYTIQRLSLWPFFASFVAGSMLPPNFSNNPHSTIPNPQSPYSAGTSATLLALSYRV